MNQKKKEKEMQQIHEYRYSEVDNKGKVVRCKIETTTAPYNNIKRKLQRQTDNRIMSIIFVGEKGYLGKTWEDKITRGISYE